MSTNKFEQIKKYLSFNDETKRVKKSDVGHDPIFHIRKVATYLMGDLNIDWFVNGTYRKRIFESISDISFKQIVTEPTRITQNSTTLIDYVITNIENTKANVKKEFKIRDHESLEILIETSSINKISTKKIIRTLAFKENVFRSELIDNEITNIS